MKTKKTFHIVVAILIIAAGVGVYFLRFSPEARKAVHLSKGERFYAAGEFDKARLEFANVIKVDPGNPLALERMGAIWLKHGVPSQAMPYLLRVKALAPSNLENRHAIPGALIEMGELPLARKEALELLRKDPADGPAWMCLAEAVIDKDETADAEKRLSAINPRGGPQHYAAGVFALRRRDLKNAEAHLLEAIKTEPSMSRAHLSMADLSMLKIDRMKSAEYIKSGSEAAPLRSRDKLRYAEYQAQTGRSDEAKAFVEGILAQAPDFVPAWVVLAQILNGKGDHAGALAAIEKVFLRDPANYEARMEQAQVYLAKNDVAKATVALEALAKEYPKSPFAKFRLACAYAAVGRWKDAQTPLEQSLTIHPGLVEAQVLLAELHLRAGRPQKVIEILPDLVAQHPKMARAGMLLGDAYRSIRRFSDAETVYQKQSIAFPNDVVCRVKLGIALRAQSKEAEARAAFEDALKLAPSNMVVIGHLVDIDVARGDSAAARGRLSGLDAKTAASAAARLLEARIAIGEKNMAKAEELLLEAIQLSPDMDPAYRLLLALYLDAGRIDSGVKQMEEKIKRRPDDLSARLLLASLYEKAGKYDAAKGAYESVIATRPDAFVALNNLACLLATRLKDPQRAEALAEKARSLQPGNTSILDTLGWSKYHRGDFEGALSLLRECAEKFSGEGTVPGEVNFHLGMANAAMGNLPQARAALEKAAQSKDDFDGKSRIATRMQMLSDDAATVPLETLQELAKESLGDLMVQLSLAEGLERAGKYPEAVKAYEGALQMNPKLALAAAHLARASSLAGADRAKVMDYAKKARALAPADPRISALIGSAAARAGDATWAYSLLLEVGGQADAQTLLDFATVAYRIGKPSEARGALDRARSKPGAESIKAALTRYARMLDLSERPELAPTERAEAEDALKVDPLNLPARVVAAAAKQGNGSAATSAAYDQLLRDFPGFPIAEARLASLKLEAGEWQSAHDLATAARKLLPNDPLLALVLGQTSFRKKEFSRAAEFLVEAGRARPLDGRQLLMLGSAYFEARNKSGAADALKRAITAGLQGPELAQAESMLKQVQQ